MTSIRHPSIFARPTKPSSTPPSSAEQPNQPDAETFSRQPAPQGASSPRPPQGVPSPARPSAPQRAQGAKRAALSGRGTSKPPLHPNTPALLSAAKRATGARPLSSREARLRREASFLRKRGQQSRAEARWVKLVASRPHDIEALLDLTHCLQVQSITRSAHDPSWSTTRLLHRVVSLNPQDPGQRERLGYALFLSAWHAHLGGSPARFGSALPFLQESLRRTPRDPNLLELVGTCKAAAGDAYAAEALFTRAQDLHDKLPNSFMRLRAFSLDSQGRHDEAESWYRRVLSVSSNDPNVLGELGINLVAQHGYSPEAQGLLTRALADFPASTRYAQALTRARTKPKNRLNKVLKVLGVLLPQQSGLSVEDVPF